MVRKGMQIPTLEELFIEIIDGLVDDGSSLFRTRSREDVFSPALVMWSAICARVKGKSSLSESLSSIINGEARQVMNRRGDSKSSPEGLSNSTGGLSRARSRLDVEVVRHVCEAVTKHVMAQVSKKLRWRGRRVFLCDGTLITVARSKKNIEEFSLIANQHTPAYSPIMRCMLCHDLMSGTALVPRIGSYCGQKAIGEQTLLLPMLADLPPKSLIVADRNMGIFSVAYAAAGHGHEVLVRMTGTRARAFVPRERIEKEEFIDEAVTWTPSLAVQKTHGFGPEATVRGRFIKWSLVPLEGAKPIELLFFTTSRAPAKELVELYRGRERIENDIRSLKYTLGLERIYSKTPEMAEKELLLGVAAYNLLRALAQRSAEIIDIPPRQISFSRCAELTRIYGNKLRDVTTLAEQEAIVTQFLTGLKQTRLPNRPPHRIEPRQVARTRRIFPPLKTSRDKARIDAQQTIVATGHRGFLTSVSRKS